MRPHDLAPAADGPWASAVLLHPHPDMGGDRFNNVVGALYHALPPAGITAVRFDFSSSDLEPAAAETIEMLDLLTETREAMRATERQRRSGHTRPAWPGNADSLFLIGYSFGGGIAATITDERVAGWLLVAPALTMIEPRIGDDPRPKLIAAAERDKFFPPDELEATAARWQATELTMIGGADHFFIGRTDVLAAGCVEWIRRVAR